ncbi:unnamed protein product (macronuclear) [Paramecium tetraurelia]|uniref:Protein kinase domain-containing protein n=1 Tax=Paramecium tetraurelia TaxID=5888 RepID=A0E2I3_PARTE|nr:uncharacterized protein GSPATT00022672001 [Paramecium tetraurelia]CAK89500.1 unnamed protein product [Paramecium tetraurelia]|eukprot:XP_001456897.1 hypothetical protein (macronuclear) [Paramecium tetraurelia strain d4-2]
MASNLVFQNQYQQHENENIILINGIKYEKIYPPIGSGSEGIIYKGINVQTKQKVAIKESHRCDQRMINVLQTIFQKNCSHIIGIYGFQQTQNQGVIVVMEQAHGEFYEFMKYDEFKKMTYAEKNSLFIQMVIGVQQLHQLGLFHRDLKPENFVYIKGENNKITIKLIDFGFAKQIQNQLRNTYKVGTPYYMAPEVMGTQGILYSKSVDIWSLGAIWYEVLVGQVFFKCNFQQNIQYFILNQKQEDIDLQIEQNQSIQNKEKQFIKQMLRKDHLTRLNLHDILTAYNSNGQQKFQIFKPLINRQEEQKIQEEARNQLSKSITNQKYQEQLDEMKRDLGRKIEQELQAKYDKLQDDYKIRLENQIKEKQNEIKEQQEKAQKYEQNIQEITQMKIQQEIQFQIQMDQFRQQKDDEYNDQIKKLKQEASQEKEQKIQEQVKQLEESLRLQYENKYLLEYNQKVTQMEQKQELKYQQQLQAKRQNLLNLVQFQQDTINSFINQLQLQLQNLTDLNVQNNQEDQLRSQINKEIDQNNDQIIMILQAQQEIEQLQTLEMLQEQEDKLVSEQKNYVQQQFIVINKISVQINAIEKQLRSTIQIEKQEQEREQQLNKLKKIYQTQLESSQQFFSSITPDIKKIQEKMQIYEEIQFHFQEKSCIQDVLQSYQKITLDLEMLRYKQNDICQFEQLQQIIQYQSLICKLEELQQPISQLKKSTQNTIQSIKTIDEEFINKQQKLIEDLQDQVNDYIEKLQYLSQNQKYRQEIKKQLNQLEDSQSKSEYLNQILNHGIFQNYQEFNQVYNSLWQQLQNSQKYHNDISEQIYHDEQIQLRNAQRIKVFETAQTKLKNSIDKFQNLQKDFDNLFSNQGCRVASNKSVINKKFETINQKISEYENLYQKCQQFDKQDSCEISKININELEQVQEKLKQQVDDETEHLTKLHLLMKEQQSWEQNSQQERELYQLNTQLQSQYMQFQKVKKSIKIECESNEFLRKMNDKKDYLKKTLEDQQNALNKNFHDFNENEKLFKEKFQEIENKQGRFKNQTKDLLVQLQKICQKAGQELELLINAVNQRKQINFITMDIELVETYENLQKQDLELLEEIQINSKMSNQSLNPSELNQLKVQIQKVISKLNELTKKLPSNCEIQEFNNKFKSNFESYSILYALVNYIKQFHITKYYERIKEYANRQKKKQMNQSNYIKKFYEKQSQELEQNTIKEKKSQDLLQRYNNILFKDQIKMMIEDMEEQQQQMDQTIQELELYIKQTSMVKLKGTIKNQETIKQLFNDECYKKRRFIQILEFNIIFPKN